MFLWDGRIVLDNLITWYPDYLCPLNAGLIGDIRPEPVHREPFARTVGGMSARR
jgi:hypothetical protein